MMYEHIDELKVFQLIDESLRHNHIISSSSLTTSLKLPLLVTCACVVPSTRVHVDVELRDKHGTTLFLPSKGTQGR